MVWLYTHLCESRRLNICFISNAGYKVAKFNITGGYLTIFDYKWHFKFWGFFFRTGIKDLGFVVVLFVCFLIKQLKQYKASLIYLHFKSYK